MNVAATIRQFPPSFFVPSAISADAARIKIDAARINFVRAAISEDAAAIPAVAARINFVRAAIKFVPAATALIGNSSPQMQKLSGVGATPPSGRGTLSAM
jgi:hypothetical protein